LTAELKIYGIQVGDETFKGKKIFIATGTEPFIPEIPGLKNVPYLTNMNLFDEKNGVTPSEKDC